MARPAKRRKGSPGRPAGAKKEETPGERAYRVGHLPDGEISFEVASYWLRDTHKKLGDILGRDSGSISRMRMDPADSGYRPPPSEWELLLAKRAIERITELGELAERLQDQASAATETDGA
jgi:hypothetical protein